MTHSIRILAFPGAPNLPIFTALEEGFFAEEDVDIAIEFTPSSIYQAKQVAAGNFDIAMTAFDNVVAYGEGQGAAGPDVDPGYVAVMGATQLELSLVVSPDVTGFNDLRGKTLALDALDTGFAFVLTEMLMRAGLSQGDPAYVTVGATPQRWQSVQAGEHAGTLTIEPFTTMATRAGFTVLQESTEIFDAYQGGVVAARRGFLAENPDAVAAYLRALLRSLDWLSDASNHDAACEHLKKHMPAIKPEAAGAVLKNVLNPKSGLTPGGAILPDGMRRVLDLRSRHGSGGKTLTDIERYMDLTLYDAIQSGAGA
ncbi:ABC transporter substrate-binding protein [Cognatishimia sp. F0-27]|uniref:ABC transporter substrate-binding protein n=1 Tax=Cognatishimia sp. F0-27 TaxID=2816855 RepID=UPI001D0C123D|nr:ABC transporter substrate-binding protein [Cognatishimia sp. F0-27]MCC1494546.1 ABC transporter substrate-binding protein [Cognatishimia sp. F0-27]